MRAFLRQIGLTATILVLAVSPLSPRRVGRAQTARQLPGEIQADQTPPDITITGGFAQVTGIGSSEMGFEELDRKLADFESKPSEEKSYQQLSRELSSVIHSVKFEGENVISYLSTNVSDEKSLYMFRTNLKNEIENLKSILADERKGLASYLVKGENQDAYSSYSPDLVLSSLAAQMKKSGAESVHQNRPNVSGLLGV